MKLWSDVLTSIEKNVNKHIYNNYLRNTKILNLDEKKLTLEVSSQYHKDYIQDNLMRDIQTALNEIQDKNLAVLFSIKEEGNTDKTKQPAKTETSKKKKAPLKSKSNKHNFLKNKEMGLNPTYTLDNFVVGDSNQFVHAAAVAVSKHPAQTYNPLYIYGGVGLGKSHIINAIGNKILENKKDLNVIYITAEEFINDIVQSIKNRTMDKVRLKYRKSDVLIIDDIHMLAGKERTQEEFFHTFNTLYEAGKQIVVTSDRAPKEINRLAERLRSRFQSGLLCDIGLPDIETREAILYKCLETEKVKIAPEIIHYIAKKIKYNIRDLKGVLIYLLGQHNLLKQEIDLNMARKAAKHILKESTEKETSISRIQEVVCDYFGVSIKLLISKKRQAAIVLPRQVAMYIINIMTQCSTVETGNAFGKRDHATVIHAVEKIKNLKKMDTELDKKIEKIIKELSIESV